MIESKIIQIIHKYEQFAAQLVISNTFKSNLCDSSVF
jgi:hypothetical protein